MRFDETLRRIAEIDEVALQALLDNERTGDDSEAELMRERDESLLERVDVLRGADLDVDQGALVAAVGEVASRPKIPSRFWPLGRTSRCDSRWRRR